MLKKTMKKYIQISLTTIIIALYMCKINVYKRCEIHRKCEITALFYASKTPAGALIYMFA